MAASVSISPFQGVNIIDTLKETYAQDTTEKSLVVGDNDLGELEQGNSYFNFTPSKTGYYRLTTTSVDECLCEVYKQVSGGYDEYYAWAGAYYFETGINYRICLDNYSDGQVSISIKEKEAYELNIGETIIKDHESYSLLCTFKATTTGYVDVKATQNIDGELVECELDIANSEKYEKGYLVAEGEEYTVYIYTNDELKDVTVNVNQADGNKVYLTTGNTSISTNSYYFRPEKEGIYNIVLLDEYGEEYDDSPVEISSVVVVDAVTKKLGVPIYLTACFLEKGTEYMVDIGGDVDNMSLSVSYIEPTVLDMTEGVIKDVKSGNNYYKFTSNISSYVSLSADEVVPYIINARSDDIGYAVEKDKDYYFYFYSYCDRDSVTYTFTESPIYHTDTMWYRYNYGNMDIRGYSDEGLIKTTYENDGYFTYIKCDGSYEDDYANEFSNISFTENNKPVTHASGLVVTPNMSFSEDGSYVIVTYNIANPTNEDKVFSLNVNSDVMIAEDDCATVELTNTGFKMVSDLGMTYYLICNNVKGVTDADTMWFGYYYDRGNHLWDDFEVSRFAGDDSGFCLAWQNRKVEAGKNINITYQLGVGETGTIVLPKDTVVASGECGEALRWTLNSEGTLTIRGTGSMPDYEPGKAPWYEWAAAIKKVVVGYGVKRVGAYAFYNIGTINQVKISATVEEIGDKAIGFTDNGKVEDIIIDAITGSAAEDYAKENEIEVGQLGDANGDTCSHNYEVEEETPATCTAAGNKKYVCLICGDVKNEKIDAKGHSYETRVVAPTCTEKGYTIHTCIYGDDSYNDEYVDATVHADIYTVKENIVEATCTQKGSYDDVQYCGVCKKEIIRENKSTPAKGHNTTVIRNAKKATYTSYGYTGDKYCPDCNVCLEKGKIIAKLAKLNNSISATVAYNKVASTKAQTFVLNAKDKSGKLKYTSNNKNVAVAQNGKVTIAKNFAGKAVITVTAGNEKYKTATKKITITVKPAVSSITKLKNVKGKKISVTWKKLSYATGYEVSYSTNKAFNKEKIVNVNKASTVTKTIAKLTKNKKYFVRVRAYKTVGKEKIYGEWSTTKNVVVKK